MLTHCLDQDSTFSDAHLLMAQVNVTPFGCHKIHRSSKLCCAGAWQVVGSIPRKGHFQYIYFFSISSFFSLKHKIYLNFFTRISTHYCLYDALRKMPYFRKFWTYSRAIVHRDWFEWCLFSSKSLYLTKSIQSSHCDRTVSILSESLGFFWFSPSHYRLNETSVLVDAKKQLASFPFSHRFIFSKETSNLPSNPWRLGWATILRWIKAQVDISSFHPVRMELKTA